MIRKILIIGVLVATVGFAQRGGGRGGGGGGGGGGMPAGMRAQTSRIDTFTTIFTLNKDQKRDVKTLFDDAQKEANPLRDQLSKSRLAIGDAVQAGKAGADLEGVIKANAALEAQMSAIEARTFAKLFKMLDKEQQSKAGAVFAMMKGIFGGKNWNTPE
jgi:hypothetical protein